MKNKVKLAILIPTLLCLAGSAISLSFAQGVEASELIPPEGVRITNLTYNVGVPTQAPQTYEAYAWLPELSLAELGSTIRAGSLVSGYNGTENSSHYNASSFEIFTNGNLSFFWAANRYTLTAATNNMPGKSTNPEDYNMWKGRWLHLAAVRDVSLSRLSFYVDGDLFGYINFNAGLSTNLPNTTYSYTTLNQYYVGASSYDSNTKPFDVSLFGSTKVINAQAYYGKIAGAILWSTARTEQQIETDAKSLPSIPTANLLFSSSYNDNISPVLTYDGDPEDIIDLETSSVATFESSILELVTFTDNVSGLATAASTVFDYEPGAITGGQFNSGIHEIIITAGDFVGNTTALTIRVKYEPENIGPEITYTGPSFLTFDFSLGFEQIEEQILSYVQIADNVDVDLEPTLTYEQEMFDEFDQLVNGYHQVTIEVTDSSENTTSIDIPFYIQNGTDFSTDWLEGNWQKNDSKTKDIWLDEWEAGKFPSWTNVQAWIKIPDGGPLNQLNTLGVIFGNYFTSTEANIIGTMNFGFDSSHRLALNLQNKSHPLIGYNFRTDTWTHVAATINYSAREINYYVNGAIAGIVAFDPSLPNNPFPTNHTFHIGSDARTGNTTNGGNWRDTFMGEIASVAVFTSPRNGADINNDIKGIEQDNDDLILYRETPKDVIAPLVSVEFNGQPLEHGSTIDLPYHQLTSNLFTISINDNLDANASYRYEYSEGAYDDIYGWLNPGEHTLTIIAEDRTGNQTVMVIYISVESAPVVPEPLDFNSLELVVAQAQSKEEKLYTVESWQVLEDALSQAVLLLQSDEVNQDEIDTATLNLQTAMENLVLISIVIDVPADSITNTQPLIITIIVVSSVVVLSALTMFVVVPLVAKKKGKAL